MMGGAASSPLPPSDISLEQACIGVALTDAIEGGTLLSILEPDDFFDPFHQRIWRTLTDARRDGTQHTAITITGTMTGDPGLAELGAGYFRSLARAAPAVPNSVAYARILRDLAARRDLARLGEDLIAEAGHINGAGTACDALGHMVQERSRLIIERASPSAAITAQPFAWRDAATIPPREWVFGKHAVRRFVSVTASAGGIGKSSLALAELLSVATGRNLLNDAQPSQGRVWYIGIEDPLIEYERRIAAAMILHKLTAADIQGSFFINSGRDQSFTIATGSRDGLIIHRPLSEAIIANIREHEIALLVVDPFVAAHAVPESDNTLIQSVVGEFARIAELTGCAVELVHHVRKGGGNASNDATTADDMRGASAFGNAARSVRILTQMNKDEAIRAGVDERRRFFRVGIGKANLSLPVESGGAWRELVPITLRNGVDGINGGAADHVGAVAAWRFPNASDLASMTELGTIMGMIDAKAWRADPQAKDWVGHAVANVLGLDMTDDNAKASVKQALSGWLADGTLRKVERHDDASRKTRIFIERADR
jgi:hypothetical protein